MRWEPPDDLHHSVSVAHHGVGAGEVVHQVRYFVIGSRQRLCNMKIGKGLFKAAHTLQHCTTVCEESSTIVRVKRVRNGSNRIVVCAQCAHIGPVAVAGVCICYASRNIRFKIILLASVGTKTTQ